VRLEERYRKKMVLGQDGNHLVNLIVAVAVAFMILKLIFVIYKMSGLSDELYYAHIFNWFTLPADAGNLLSKPWTLITYMFAEDRIFYALGNLLWLGAFGFIMQDLAGNGKIIPVFVYGSLAGALCVLLCYALFPKLSAVADATTLYGAATGVMALAVATTMLSPDYRIFPMLSGGIPLWVLAFIFLVISFATVPGNYAGGYIALTGSGAMGILFVYQMRRGNDWGAWMNNFFDWVANLFNPARPKKSKIRQKYFYKVGKTSPYRKVPNVTQKRIDEILDKINLKGYHFLTEEEKEILKRASENDNL
jgi:membrane associated rhomboid family serine protease